MTDPFVIEDASRFEGKADRIVFPSTEAEIIEILRQAQREKTPVTVSGAGTGLTGARVPLSGILLSTEKLNRILRIDLPEGRVTPPPDSVPPHPVAGPAPWADPPSADETGGGVTLQPGVTLQKLEEALQAQGLLYPPDPGEKKAFIGGTVATNASGSRSFKYGPTRRYVRRLRIVLPDGNPLDLTRGQLLAKRNSLEIPLSDGKIGKVPIPTYSMPAVKNAAGYYAAPGMDLIDLFIGSEGTLGIFTEIELAILKAPEALSSGILFFDSEKACFRFSKECLSFQLDPRVLEFFDSQSLKLLTERHPDIPAQARAALLFEEECRSGEQTSVRKRWIKALDRAAGFVPDPWLSLEPEGHRRFRQLRYDLPVLVNEQVKRNRFRKVGTDFAVPGQAAEAMLDFYLEVLGNSGMDHCLFGHLGDHHLHANLLPKTEDQFKRSKELYSLLAEKALKLGGTISAEHGIGKLRIPYLERMVGKEGLKQMARVKKALDPEGILNPGNIFPVELLKES